MDRRSFALGALLAPLALREATASVMSRLNEPRTHALMRHALAPGTGDPARFVLEDCSTQRNLSEQGRAQAALTGEMLRASGARVDHLWSSQWCRCLDTARLMEVGTVVEQPALNSFFENRATEPAQSAEIRRLLASLPSEETAFCVTHQVNITALTRSGVSSGEIFVVRVDERGTVSTLERITVPLG
ncbi:MAG: histidine phosphatase family protein [Pseudomonadota bacterium]